MTACSVSDFLRDPRTADLFRQAWEAADEAGRAGSRTNRALGVLANVWLAGGIDAMRQAERDEAAWENHLDRIAEQDEAREGEG